MARLSTADIAKCRTPIQQADLLVADGYLLLHEDSRRAVLAAARTASIARTRFCLDLVPHDIERYLSVRQVAVCVDKADIVISGARTVARLMSLHASYPYPADGILPLARALGRYFDDRITWLLRFGDGDMDQVAVCRGGVVRSRYPTGYRECVEKTGFGDRIASTELSDLLRADDR
jgi:sugar/nucleoside kinase (ribokinase family)